MGTWSPALYGSDVANDIRENIKELLRTPLDEDGVVEKLADLYPNLKNKVDEEYPDMWLVLADQFHAHGLKAARVFAAANSIIDTGLDLETKRACAMVERDLRKRAKVLADLRAKWAKPNPKPVKRNVQEKPDALVFDTGDCFTYPATDSYGAGVVLARGHYLGTFSWYAVARLSLQAREKPTLAECAAAMIDSESSVLDKHLGEKPTLCIHASRLTPDQRRKLRIETIGRLVPNTKAIRADLAAFFKPFTPGLNLANDLSGFGVRAPSAVPIARYATLERA